MNKKTQRRILYFNAECRTWQEKSRGIYQETMKGIEITGLCLIEDGYRKMQETTFDVVAVHHNCGITWTFAKKARKIFPNALVLAVTNSINDLEVERRTYLRGLEEEHQFDDIVVGTRSDTEGTIEKLVRVLEEIEAQQRAAGVTC